MISSYLREQVDALCAATDTARAMAGLSRLESETALAEVAQRAGSWEIRLAAARRVTDPDLLERIVEATRHRDNRVFRHCSDLLRARRRALGNTMRAAQLAAAFRGILLGGSDHQALPADQFNALDVELASLQQEGEVPQECLELAAALRQRVKAEAQALRDLGSDAAEAEALCAQIEAARQADGDIWQARLRTLEERASRRAAWLAGHPTAVALANSIARGQAVLEALTPAPKPKPKPKRADSAGAPESARKAPPATRPAVEPAAVRELLERLASQVQAGQLAEAEETERRIIAQANAGALPESLARRMRRERAQLGRMRDWARWGSDQSREHLIQAAQELLQGGRDPENLAAAVTGLREQWKRLDASRQATRKQWESFDAILARAFQPVLEFRALRATEEEASAAAKSSLCDQCEAWSAGIDWERCDIRAAAARRHEFANQWRALRFAGFRAERKLRKRFDTLLKGVDRQVGAARQAEFGRREALIREAETLREAPHADNKVKSAMALQARWKDGARSVGLARQEEQVLWRRFHAACNEVFAQRDARRNAREAERAARDAERSRVLNERKARETRKRDAARNRFELLARDSLAAAAQASAAELDQGYAVRETLLLDLELALDLPSPPSAAGARRARQLLRLQERFRPGNSQSPDPEALVLRWYATAARSDPEHDARMSAVVEALLKAASAGGPRP